MDYAVKIKNIADRADAYGIPGVVIDGMDFFDVYDKVLQALQRARSGEGPTLLEAKTYRYFGHYEGDAMRYRTRAEEHNYRDRDPITSFKRRVLAEGLLTAADCERIEMKTISAIESAVKAAEEAPLPLPQDCLSDVYVTYP